MEFFRHKQTYLWFLPLQGTNRWMAI